MTSSLPRPRSFEAKSTLASSDNSFVYRVIDDLGRSWIIKTLAGNVPTPEQIADFYREMDILALLKDCPEFMQAEERIVFRDRVGILFPDWQLTSLDRRDQSALELQVFFPLARSICESLSKIHQHRIVHKDINPRNILVDEAYSNPTIIDFSCAIKLARGSHAVSNEGKLEGSLQYISPEQTGRTAMEIDYRSDYYSLGVVLYELLTGELPFTAKDPSEWIYHHLATRMPALPESLPHGLCGLLGKLTAKNPSERYQSVAGIIADLNRIEAGVGADFIPGEDDYSEQFTIPSKLYGRELEVQGLGEVFERMSEYQGERIEDALTLLAGPAGIGKSALVRSLLNPVARQHGVLLEGKFEQYQGEEALLGIRRAFSQLLDFTLVHSPQLLENAARVIEASDAGGLDMLTAALPELRFMKQEHSESESAESTHFDGAKVGELLAIFLKVVADKHPLVFFIDDLQWADHASYACLEVLARRHLKNVLLIGAYRDDEVSADHPLQRMLADLADRITTLEIGPIELPAINELVSDVFPGQEDVAATIVSKSGGNPLYVHRLINQLYWDGYIGLKNSRWHLQVEGLNGLSLADNVVDFILNQLQHLSETERLVVACAAVFGARFDLTNVGSVLKLNLSELSAAVQKISAYDLWTPLAESSRYLLAGGEVLKDRPYPMKFGHDRLQEACYKMVGPDKASNLHYAVARALSQSDADVVQAASHFVRCRGLIPVTEQLEVVKTFWQASSVAFRSSSFELSGNYIEAALDFLNDGLWDQEFSTCWEIANFASQVRFVNKDFDATSQVNDVLMSRARTPFEKAQVHYRQCQQANQRYLYHECIDQAVAGLVQLGIPAKKRSMWVEAITYLAMALGKYKKLDKDPGLEGILELSDNASPEFILANQMILMTTTASYFSNRHDLLIYLNSRSLLWALQEKFVCAEFASVLSLFAAISRSQGDAGLAKRSDNLTERFVTRGFKGHSKFLEAYFTARLRIAGHPYTVTLNQLVDGLYASIGELEESDEHLFFVSAIGAYHSARMLRSVGPEVSKAFFSFFRDKLVGELDVELLVSASFLVSFNENVTSEDIDQVDFKKSYCDVESALLTMRKDRMPFVESGYGMYQSLTYLLRDDLEQAYSWVIRFDKLIHSNAPSVVDVCSRIVYCLAVLSYHQRCGTKLSRRENRYLQKDLKFFRNNCAEFPLGFSFIIAFVDAEMAYYRGENLSTIVPLLEEAKEGALSNGHNLIAGLAAFRTARLLLDHNCQVAAHAHLRQAKSIYTIWGGVQIVAWIDATFPMVEENPYVQTGSTDITSRSISARSIAATTSKAMRLDEAQVLKLSRQISKEVVLDKLLTRLLSVCCETTGSHVGAVILHDDQGNLLSHGIYSPGVSELNKDPLPVDSSELPLEILRLCDAKGEPLLLNDVADSTFAQIPCLQANGVRSLICLPAKSQNRINAILYLENRMAAHAFNQERHHLLDVFVSQASISIDNARLYETLEEKVRDRTRSLNEQIRDNRSILNSLQQGILTFRHDFKILPDYSPFLRTIFADHHCAGRDVIDALFENSDVPADIQAQTRTAFDMSFGEELMNFQINAHVLPKEFHTNDKTIEVEWIPMIFEGEINKALVSLRDVTEERRLKGEAAKRSLEIDVIGQVHQLGRRRTESFLAESKQLVEQIVAIPWEQLDQLKLEIHTLKGSARIVGFGHLVEIVHEIESALESGSSDHLSGLQNQLADCFATYCSTAQNYLGGGRSGDEDRLQRLLSYIRSEQAAESSWQKLADMTQKLTFERELEAEIKSCQDYAATVGKESPRFEFSVDDLSLELSPVLDKLRPALVHLFSNSIDHGIEPADSREGLGKPKEGTMFLQLCSTADQLKMSFGDDGQGLLLEKIAKKSGLTEGQLGDEEIADLIFQKDMSTKEAVTTVSGRGVGMSAVRQLIEEMHGTCNVRLLPESSTSEGRPFTIEITLPKAS